MNQRTLVNTLIVVPFRLTTNFGGTELCDDNKTGLQNCISVHAAQLHVVDSFSLNIGSRSHCKLNPLFLLTIVVHFVVYSSCLHDSLIKPKIAEREIHFTTRNSLYNNNLSILSEKEKIIDMHLYSDLTRIVI